MKHKLIYPVLYLLVLIVFNLSSTPARIVTANRDDATPSTQVRFNTLWELDPVTVEGEVNPLPIITMAWSPDGQNLAVVYETEHAIRILDANSGEVRFKIDVSEQTSLGSTKVAWSPNGKYLAGSFDITSNPLFGNVRIWEISNQSAQVLTSFERPVSSRYFTLDWNESSTKLAISYSIYTEPEDILKLEIRDATTGKLLAEKESMLVGAWSPDGKTLLVLSDRGRVIGINTKVLDFELIDSTNFQTIMQFPIPNKDDHSTHFVAWAKTSNLIAGTNCNLSHDCYAWLWYVQTNKIIRLEPSLSLTSAGYSSPALSSSSKHLAFAEEYSETLEDILYFWNTNTGELYMPLQWQSTVYVIAWHPTRDILAVASEDGVLQVGEIAFSPK